MKINISENYEAMSEACASFIADLVKTKPNALISLPSGDTPTGLMRQLVSRVQEKKMDISQVRFLGLDEWVGMGKEDEGSCKHYMYEQLFDPLNVNEDQIIFFDARAAHPDQECARIDQIIAENGGIDLMVVGIGMNGHIGLNEPGTSFDSYSHVSQLDNTTQQVAQKYFQTQAVLRGGITLGLKHFAEAGTAMLMASGMKKAEIIRQALEDDVTENVPASIVQKHPNGYVFLDKEAASALKNQGEVKNPGS